MESIWRRTREWPHVYRILLGCLIAIIVIAAFSSGIALADYLATPQLVPSEAGHVLVVMYDNIHVLDANGARSAVRSCSGPKNDDRIIQFNLDVVVLSDHVVTIQGEPYYLVAYPDPCDPKDGYSSDDAIARAIQQAQNKQPILAAAVGYVAADRLSEADRVTSVNNNTLLRNCWPATSCDSAPINPGASLPSANTQALYAEWTGSAWDPHWWHAQIPQKLARSATQAAVYGRDWRAQPTNKPAAPASAFAYVITYLDHGQVTSNKNSLSTTIELENDGERGWQTANPDTSLVPVVCPKDNPGNQPCSALNALSQNVSIVGSRAIVAVSGKVTQPHGSLSECVYGQQSQGNGQYTQLQYTAPLPLPPTSWHSPCIVIPAPTSTPIPTPSPSAAASPSTSPSPSPTVAPPTPTPTATTPPSPTWHTALSEPGPSCNIPNTEHWYPPLNAAPPNTSCASGAFLMQQNSSSGTIIGDVDLQYFTNHPHYDQATFQTSLTATFQNPGDTATYAGLLVQSPQYPNLNPGGYIFKVNSQGHWELVWVDPSTGNLSVVQSGNTGASSAPQIKVQLQNQTLTGYINGNLVVTQSNSLGTTNTEEMGIITEKDGSVNSSWVSYTNFNLSFWY